MTDLTHLDLLKKLEASHCERRAEYAILLQQLADMKLELHTIVKVNVTKIAQHDKDLEHVFEDIHKMEDRTWRAGGAILVSAISLVTAIGVVVLTVVL